MMDLEHGGKGKVAGQLNDALTFNDPIVDRDRPLTLVFTSGAFAGITYYSAF
jgi:hypothetical protein